MNNIIDCICRNLPHSEVRITSPTLDENQEFVVIGLDCCDTDIPVVLTKKPNTNSRFNIPYHFIDKVIIIP